MSEALPERPIQHSESRDVHVLISEAGFKLQAMLALRLYRRSHPGVQMDEREPRAVSSAIREEAMSRWLDGDEKTAINARYRAFLEKAAETSESIDLSDVNALDEILDQLNIPNETVH
ncbi:MAG: hypothetical protein AB203_03540 [Parcubacteria bacterium C7867-008]|nr:MAG: hypothetical protein AB203_03540 [Parcubacteria bacterium C7867-008]